MIPRRFFWLFDLLLVGAAFAGAYYLMPAAYPGLLGEGGLFRIHAVETLFSPTLSSGVLPPAGSLVWIILVAAPTILLVLNVSGNYEPLIDLSRTRVVVGSFLASFVGLSLAALILVTLNGTAWSRLFAFSFATLAAAGLAIYRLVLRWYFRYRRSTGYYAKNVLLVGPPSAIDWMTRYFAEHVDMNYCRVYGYLQVVSEPVAVHVAAGGRSVVELIRGSTSAEKREMAFLGEVADLGDLLVHRPVHEVVVVYPSSGGGWLNQVIRDCDYFRVALRIVPEALLSGELHDLQAMYRSGPFQLPAVVLTPPDLDSEALFLKRILDIVVSALMLVLFAPLFLVIAVAIKLTTPHLPVFYPWRVVGRNGVEFTGYKFTTMFADADERRASLIAKNEMSGPVFKVSNDPRVTPLGRFLRRFSLNELPQLWSVLKGDMSLVGPRPAFRHELDRYELWHKRKLSVKPGITCLWQVRGRNKIKRFDDWVRMDLEYIDNWSLWLDLKILLRTAFIIFIPAEG